MDSVRVVKTLSKAFVVVVFWIVFFVSLVLMPVITVNTLIFALIKSFLVSAVLWVLVVIIFDSLVKTIIADAEEKEAQRIDGGLSYHFIKPDINELQHEEENLADKNKADKKS